MVKSYGDYMQTHMCDRRLSRPYAIVVNATLAAAVGGRMLLPRHERSQWSALGKIRSDDDDDDDWTQFIRSVVA